MSAFTRPMVRLNDETTHLLERNPLALGGRTQMSE